MSETTSKPPALGRKTARGLKPFRGERAAQLVPQARLAGPMPWVIAIMVTLTVIAAAGGLALNNVASTARAELAGGVIVQIVEASSEERSRQAVAAEALLAEHPAVASTRRVPDEELDALLEPWLGVGTDNEAVPMPALIDVRLREDATEETLDTLRGILEAAAPAARIDAQSSWLAPVFSTISSLQWLSGALVILLGLTSAAAVWLAARSALGTNRDTIEIVHLLGGTDTQIARIFERSIGFDATLGGAVGLALGLGAVLFLGQEFSALGSGMMSGGGLGSLDWILIAIIPFIAVAIAMLTARFTVVSALRRML
ncbi:cell division protein [Pontixanthobacter aestiaquae]|uniref:cell division protein FtsX n=1 Tax=Pontixanthobacter aestiaquae TaxID=1509367 RepID=UPI0025B289D8|nr:cell division protein [Pontixanthobacter aestiaquae]MDN3644583.1 cell division protein [Pontixanthobacter aestiaquae]